MARARTASRQHGRARPERTPSRRPLVLAAAIAVIGTVALVLYGNASAPSASPSPAAAASQTTRVRGSAAAPVTIEQYADFQCPACGLFARTTEKQLIATYVAAGTVKLVYHHFAFLGMESSWAAEAAECAGEQGRFWEMHDRLYASQAGENRGTFSRSNLKVMGDQLGLGAGFGTCIDSGRHAQAVRDATRDGSARGVKATPTLFIDGQRIEGAATYEQLRAIIDAALAR